jgi:hypothetical protein
MVKILQKYNFPKNETSKIYHQKKTMYFVISKLYLLQHLYHHGVDFQLANNHPKNHQCAERREQIVKVQANHIDDKIQNENVIQRMRRDT